MLRLAADENFNHDIVRGLLRHRPETDIVSIQDVGLAGADDPAILAWCADQDRVLLTHDVSTITRFAYERLQAGERMPGVFEVSQELPLGTVIADILLLVEFSLEREWDGQVRYFPLR